MKKIKNLSLVIIAITLFGCNPDKSTVITHNQKDTSVVYPLDVTIPPIELITIIIPLDTTVTSPTIPEDTFILAPVLPVLKLKPSK